MRFLELAGICIQEAAHLVLNNISFTQDQFEQIAIAGATGSGKSTLLQTIAGLVQSSAGSVIFEGKKVRGPADKLVPGHADIAYLSQQYELPGFLRVEQVLRYANKLTPEAANRIYEVCRISHLLGRRTDQLSGGERQRIALALLLVTAPQLLLLDEPYSNLDMGHKSILKAVIEDISEELDITCTLISHDPADTLSWADKILVLQDGQILQQGTPEQIYRQPVNAYVAGLFGKYNTIPAHQARAFARFTGVQENGKTLLVRPEHFQLVASADQGLAGTVRKVQFFGSYHEIEVQLAEVAVTVRTAEAAVAKGDTVYLSVSPEGIWYL